MPIKASVTSKSEGSVSVLRNTAKYLSVYSSTLSRPALMEKPRLGERVLYTQIVLIAIRRRRHILISCCSIQIYVSW